MPRNTAIITICPPAGTRYSALMEQGLPDRARPQQRLRHRCLAGHRCGNPRFRARRARMWRRANNVRSRTVVQEGALFGHAVTLELRFYLSRTHVGRRTRDLLMRARLVLIVAVVAPACAAAGAAARATGGAAARTGRAPRAAAGGGAGPAV